MTDAARIDELEIRIAHQDAIIEELNATVTEQWKVIDRLTRQLDKLNDRVSTGEHSAIRAGDEPPPPHY